MNAYKNQRCWLMVVWLLVTALSSAVINTLMAQEAGQVSCMSPCFVDAEPIKRLPPIYPRRQQESSNSGMVDVTYMVNADGTVFEPMVVQSSHEHFERAAIDAVNNYKFSPALLSGEPIESVEEIRIFFRMQKSEDAATRLFARRYQSARKNLESESANQSKVASNIKRMENGNYLSPYAYAHLNLLRYLYAEQFGSLKDQIDAIELTLMFEGRTGKKGKFLDDEIALNMRRNLFVLNVKAQRYGDAVSAYRELKKIDEQAEVKYGRAMVEIHEIQESEQSVVTELDIHQRGYTSLNLFKRAFSFSDVQGELTNIKLRCRNKFADLPLQLESEYKVPDSWGYCNLQVIGTANTTFRLVQI